MASSEKTTVGRLLVDGVEKRFDGVRVLHGVDLDVPAGSMCALLGPSGSGKTTLLRLIAGLETADAGTISLDGRVLTGNGTFVQPERRRIGMVFQDWALFPHLSVGQNVAFGLPRGATRRGRVAEVLEMVGLDGYGDRAPATLSGGQQQRVALARALAPEPEVLLLDEPFSNLDVALRVRVRSEVQRLLAEAAVTTVFVTHDQEEAFVLGNHVAVMREGRLVQVGTPQAIYERPADSWVASFVGDANLLPGVAHDGMAQTPLGTIPVVESGLGDVQVLIRPEHLVVSPGDGANGGVARVLRARHRPRRASRRLTNRSRSRRQRRLPKFAIAWKSATAARRHWRSRQQCSRRQNRRQGGDSTGADSIQG